MASGWELWAWCLVGLPVCVWVFDGYTSLVEPFPAIGNPHSLHDADRASMILGFGGEFRPGKGFICTTHRLAAYPADSGTKSSPRSSALAEWVITPTEMKSTPVSAIARTVLRVTPPLASSTGPPEPRI